MNEVCTRVGPRHLNGETSFSVLGPMALGAGGLPGKAAAAALGGFSAYDTLKSEAVGKANQIQDTAGGQMRN